MLDFIDIKSCSNRPHPPASHNGLCNVSAAGMPTDRCSMPSNYIAYVAPPPAVDCGVHRSSSTRIVTSSGNEPVHVKYVGHVCRSPTLRPSDPRQSGSPRSATSILSLGDTPPGHMFNRFVVTHVHMDGKELNMLLALEAHTHRI